MAFSEIIAKDTRVPSTGKKVTCSQNQKSYTLKLYFTKKDNPTVIDDSFQQLGTLKFQLQTILKGSGKLEKFSSLVLLKFRFLQE